MKTKKKLIAMLEIAIVLCSIFLVAIPAIADEQIAQEASANTITTASEDDYVLGIYGNANEDDTIDMGDVVYTKLAIFGKKPKTELCDAKYDGRINVLDVIQTKLIILGKEKEMTVIDRRERIVTVKKPIERVVWLLPSPIEPIRILKVSKDAVVGINHDRLEPDIFPEFSDVPDIGLWRGPDVEMILAQNPDVVILYESRSGTLDRGMEALEAAGVTVFRFHFNRPKNLDIDLTKAGYIFEKEDEAEEFLDWREDLLNLIEEKVEKIPEEDKPKVYYESSQPYTTAGSSPHVMDHITMAGGKLLFPGVSGSVDPEAVIERNPDIIVKKVYWAGSYDMDVGDTAELEEMRKEIMSRPELQNVKAVKNGRVHIISSRISAYGPFSGCRHSVGQSYLAKWFHPTLFEDFDPKAIHQEYLTRILEVNIDLEKKGVFVYPEPS